MRLLRASDTPGLDETAHHLRWGLVTETPAAPSATDSHERLLDLIKAHAIVHGRVTLSSGKEADYYVDLRRITLDGGAAPLVGRVMLDLTADLEFDAVGGLTLGADPVAAAMLHAAAAPGPRSSTRSSSARPRRRTACSAHRGPGRRRPPRARRRGHLHHRRLGADRGRGRCARPAPRSWPWPSSSTARAVRQERIEAQGLPYLAAYSVAELGLG